MKLTITIDSEDYEKNKGHQDCNSCPLSYLCYTKAQGITDGCMRLFLRLFGESCDEIEVKGKPIVTTENK